MPLQWLVHDGTSTPLLTPSEYVHIICDGDRPAEPRPPLPVVSYHWRWASRCGPVRGEITQYARALRDATGMPYYITAWRPFTPGPRARPVNNDAYVQVITLGARDRIIEEDSLHGFLTARNFNWTLRDRPNSITHYRTLTYLSPTAAAPAPRRLTAEQKHIADSLPDWARPFHERLCLGAYDPAPWHAEPWAQHPPTDPRFLHFLHISQTQSGLLAYIPQPPATGAKPIIIPIKPGRYLQRFYPDALTPTEIKSFAAQVRGKATTLHITRDAAAIVSIYQSVGAACMSHSTSHYRAASNNGGKHPASFYGTSPDLALAYITPENAAEGSRPLARAIVWPSRKLYARCYGDTEAMIEALQAEGYAAAPLDGARLPLVPISGDFKRVPPAYFNCPYIDHAKWARADTASGFLILQERATGATHSVQHGDGIAYPIHDAPPRPIRTTSESIADEHARLCALESGNPPPATADQPELELDPHLAGATMWRHSPTIMDAFTRSIRVQGSRTLRVNHIDEPAPIIDDPQQF